MLTCFFDHNHTCVLLNISALLAQFGIQAFDEFKHPECTRLHLRELQFETFSQGSMPPDPPRMSRCWRSRWGYRVHIDTTLYLSAPSITKSSVRPCIHNLYFFSHLRVARKLNISEKRTTKYSFKKLHKISNISKELKTKFTFYLYNIYIRRPACQG